MRLPNRGYQRGIGASGHPNALFLQLTTLDPFPLKAKKSFESHTKQDPKEGTFMGELVSCRRARVIRKSRGNWPGGMYNTSSAKVIRIRSCMNHALAGFMNPGFQPLSVVLFGVQILQSHQSKCPSRTMRENRGG